jgi:hypothetical protein
MTEHQQHHDRVADPDAPPRVEPGHPTGQPGQGVDEEIDSGLLYKSGITLLIVTIVAMVAMWLMVRLFEGQDDRAARPPSPLAEANQRAVPPGPLLQVGAEQDLRTFRAAEAQELAGYGWVDRTGGVAHIPIERAMELLLAQGDALAPVPAIAPVPEPAPVAAVTPSAAPSGHGGGR